MTELEKYIDVEISEDLQFHFTQDAWGTWGWGNNQRSRGCITNDGVIHIISTFSEPITNPPNTQYIRGTYHNYSSDKGSTWTRNKIWDYNLAGESIASDGKNIFLFGYREKNVSIYMVYDGGTSTWSDLNDFTIEDMVLFWKPPYLPYNSPYSAHPSFCCDSSGRLHVVYPAETYPKTIRHRIKPSILAGEWSEPSTVDIHVPNHFVGKPVEVARPEACVPCDSGIAITYYLRSAYFENSSHTRSHTSISIFNGHSWKDQTLEINGSDPSDTFNYERDLTFSYISICKNYRGGISAVFLTYELSYNENHIIRVKKFENGNWGKTLQRSSPPLIESYNELPSISCDKDNNLYITFYNFVDDYWWHEVLFSFCITKDNKFTEYEMTSFTGLKGFDGQINNSNFDLTITNYVLSFSSFCTEVNTSFIFAYYLFGIDGTMGDLSAYNQGTCVLKISLKEEEKEENDCVENNTYLTPGKPIPESPFSDYVENFNHLYTYQMYEVCLEENVPFTVELDYDPEVYSHSFLRSTSSTGFYINKLNHRIREDFSVKLKISYNHSPSAYKIQVYSNINCLPRICTLYWTSSSSVWNLQSYGYGSRTSSIQIPAVYDQWIEFKITNLYTYLRTECGEEYKIPTEINSYNISDESLEIHGQGSSTGGGWSYIKDLYIDGNLEFSVNQDWWNVLSGELRVYEERSNILYLELIPPKNEDGLRKEPTWQWLPQPFAPEWYSERPYAGWQFALNNIQDYWNYDTEPPISLSIVPQYTGKYVLVVLGYYLKEGTECPVCVPYDIVYSGGKTCIDYKHIDVSLDGVD